MPDRYLSRNIGNVTEDEVVDMMGEPTERGRVRDGRVQWLYRQYVSDRRDSTTAAAEQPDCAQYRLVFDDRKVLREWLREECL